MHKKPYPRTMKSGEVAKLYGRYEITRLSDSKVEFRKKLPRRDSKWWDKSRYMVWDNELNQAAIKARN